MSKELCKTTYEAGPEDELLVKDVYKSSSSAVVNSYQDKNPENASIMDFISGLNPAALLGKINQAVGMVNSTLNAVKNMANGGLTGVLGNLGNMAGLGNLGNMGRGLDLKGSLLSSFANMGGLSSIVAGVNQGMGQVRALTSTIKGLEHSVAGGLGGVLGGDLGAASSIASGIFSPNRAMNLFNSFDSKNGPVSLESITQNLSGGNLDVFSAINDIPGEYHPYMGGGFNQNAINNNMVIKVGDAISPITQGMNNQAVEPITQIVAALTGATEIPTIINRGGTAALVSSVSHLGNQLGMPNVFGQLAPSINDKHILVEAAKPLLQRAAIQGDLRAVVNIASTTVAPEMRTIAPDLLGSVITNAQRPEKLAQQEYTKYYQSVREGFDRVDPNWMKYKRGGSEVINAAQVGGNLFFCDLIRSQMNELQHPNNYLSNYQRIYPESNAFDSSAAKAVSAALKSTENNGVTAALDISSVQAVDLDFTASGNSVGLAGSEMQAGAVNLNFDNDQFLLLSPLYKEDNVDSCLKRDFSEWYDGLDKAIDPCAYTQ